MTKRKLKSGSKWAIIADPQFDDQLSYSTIGDDGLTTRLRDYIQCFDRIVDEATDRGCRGLLVLGDIFDSRTAVTLSVIDQVCRAMSRAKDAGLELHLLVGNHDSQLRVPTVNSLQVFRGLAYIYESPQVYGQFAFMPWVEDQDEFRRGVQQLAEDPNAKYLFSHALFAGAVPEVAGRPVADLMPERWTQVVLGDVHEPVQIAPNIRYCGAPMQIHYGDAGGVRGFLILDESDDSLEFVENTWSPRFHVVKDASFISEMSEGSAAVTRGDFVRVQLHSPQEARRLVEHLSGSTDWVESVTVELPDEEPRLSVTPEHTHRQAIQSYLEYQKLDGVEGLLDTALELIDEVER
jgi:DNA repair exonuclease SbcCD nuclease subunit